MVLYKVLKKNNNNVYMIDLLNNWSISKTFDITYLHNYFLNENPLYLDIMDKFFSNEEN